MIRNFLRRTDNEGVPYWVILISAIAGVIGLEIFWDGMSILQVYIPNPISGTDNRHLISDELLAWIDKQAVQTAKIDWDQIRKGKS